MKIRLDFLTIKGSFSSIKEFSQEIKISPREITKKLKKYGKEKILNRVLGAHILATELWVRFRAEKLRS